MKNWDPASYLRFKDERSLPSRDLIARLSLKAPAEVLDIGCGPGNSTALLCDRFPGAAVTGIDSSPEMIERAKAECPRARFLTADACGDLSSLGAFDLVFANASIQWMPDHDALLRRFFVMLRPGGALAAQVPQYDRMAISRVVDRIAHSARFASYFEHFETGMHDYSEGFYYDVLCGLSNRVEIWSTHYFHVMEDYDAMIGWVASTGMKPYLDRLPPEWRGIFTDAVREKLACEYPKQKDGKILFPFQRFFFIAYRG